MERVSLMVKRCRLCNLPFEAKKSNQLYCEDCKDFLYNPPKKPPNEQSIEEINRKALAEGLSYAQYVQKHGV